MKTLYYLQHVFFETPALILDWAKEHSLNIVSTHLYKDTQFLNINDFDFLVIMGGPMGVYDDQKFPWLLEETKFIEKAIQHQKKIIGICLGAQLLADVLGGKVYKNQYKEIGFFPVQSTENIKNYNFFINFPNVFVPFHWHGDTFDLPSDAKHLFFNEATPHQGFIYQQQVVAFQFHLESTISSIEELYQNSSSDLQVSNKKYIQTIEEVKKHYHHLEEMKKLLFSFLDRFFEI